MHRRRRVFQQGCITMKAIISDNKYFALYSGNNFVYSNFFNQIKFCFNAGSGEYLVVCDDYHIFWVDEIQYKGV